MMDIRSYFRQHQMCIRNTRQNRVWCGYGESARMMEGERWRVVVITVVRGGVYRHRMLCLNSLAWYLVTHGPRGLTDTGTRSISGTHC